MTAEEKLAAIAQLCDAWDDHETPDEAVPIRRIRAILNGRSGFSGKRPDQ